MLDGHAGEWGGVARLSGTILIYGANGYTGKLIAKAAVDQGAQSIAVAGDLEKSKRSPGHSPDRTRV